MEVGGDLAKHCSKKQMNIVQNVGGLWPVSFAQVCNISGGLKF